MSLILNKIAKYTSPYFTNWDYLHNMIRLQVNPIEEITWNEYYKYISTGLWDVPYAQSFIPEAKSAMREFIERLNEKLMEL